MSASANSTESPDSLVLEALAAAADAGFVDERGVPKQLGVMERKVSIAGYDPEARTVTMAVSSETPVPRFFGDEILSHKKGAIRTQRLENGLALLFNHDDNQHLGTQSDYKLRSDAVLQVTSRFGNNPLAVEKEGDVKDKILKDVSLRYFIYELDVVEDKNGNRTCTATDWEPLEISLVTVPADPTVGVGRSIRGTERPLKVTFRKLLGDTADETSAEDTPAAPADPAPEPTPVSAPDTTTPPEAQRTQTMEPKDTPNTPAAQVVADPAAENAARVTELRSLSTQYPTFFGARQLKDAEDLGVPVAQVKRNIYDAKVAEAEKSDVGTAADEVFDGMNAADLSRYSVVGAYRAAVNLRNPGTFKGKDQEGGFEREVGETLRTKAAERGITGLGSGVIIPGSSTRSLARAQAQRALASGGNAGSATNYTVVDADPIELLRSRTTLLTMGARMLSGLHGAVQMTQQTGAGSSNWLLEGNAATETDPTLGEFTMRPNRLSMFNAYYRDLLAQSALAVDSFLSEDRFRVLALALDTAGLAGSGTAPVPLGIMNRTGLSAVLAGSTRSTNATTGAVTTTPGAGGVPMTYVDFNNMAAAIEMANADIGTLGIITTPKVKAAAKSTPKTPGTATAYIWPDSKKDNRGIEDGPLGMPSIVTSNPALTGFTANGVSGLHAVLMGVFNQILFGDWGLSEVIVDNITGAAQALYKITEVAYFDCNVRQLPAFCLCTSALPQ